MKWKLKNKNYSNLLLVITLGFTLIFNFVSSSYMRKLSGNEPLKEEQIVKVNNSQEKSNVIKKYTEENKDILIDEIDIKNNITTVLTLKDNRYVSTIFDYQTGKEKSFNDLIKSDKKEEFYQRIKELIYLKYPNFIADVISAFDKENVYYLKNNELIIYFYDYVIDPMPQEEIYLKVNYNEIAEFLNIEVELDSSYQNEDGSILNKDKKIIALTFDDGPGAYTEELVDILNANKVKATFFMLGKNLAYYKKSVLKVYNSGMEIGYHSYNHTNFKRQEKEQILAEWNTSNETLKSITGDTFHLIRPPYGAINNEIKAMFDNPFILWCVDTEDWRHRDVEYLTNYTLENISDGAIILFHDIHKTSVEAMKRILPLLYVNGYQVTTVSNLANITNTNLENHMVYRHFMR